MTNSSSQFFDESILKNFRHRTPFFVFSKEALLSNLKEYQQYLPPQTEFCYAMKANSELPVLQNLNEKGISFEVASKYELAILKNIHVPPQKIIYGTSVKPAEHISEFVKYGVDRFAFDSEQELFKIAQYAPGTRVYVRSLVDDRSDSVFHMSEKFGVTLPEAVRLLVKAQACGMIPYGISFNVGSQARNEKAWARGIKDVAIAMKQLLEKNIKIQMINIGGGFPHTYQNTDKFPSIIQISEHINLACKEIPYKVNILAEPGRGLVANTYVLITSVIERAVRAKGNWLYVDTGVYNGLLEAMAYQGTTMYDVSPLNHYPSDQKEHFILTGPTGDNLDVIRPDILLPVEIQIGDRLIIYDTGAYSFTLITPFNGFPRPDVILQ
jgi:ornithine decarboxylase